MAREEVDPFESGLKPAERLLWRALQMIGDGTLEVNTKLGKKLGADRVRVWVELAESEIGV